MVRRPSRGLRPGAVAAARSVIDDDASPPARLTAHSTEFVPLVEVLPAARARSGTEPLLRAGPGMGWEEPAGRSLPKPAVERATPRNGELRRPGGAPVAAGPVARPGAAWSSSTPTPSEEAGGRVHTQRTLVWLIGSGLAFSLSVTVVAVALWVGSAPAPGRVAPGSAPEAAPLGVVGAPEIPPAAPTVASPSGGPGGRAEGGEAAVPSGAAPTEQGRAQPSDRAVPPARRTSEPDADVRSDAAARAGAQPPADVSPPAAPKPPPAPRAVSEPKPAKVPDGMHAVAFRFNGDWGGGNIRALCGARFNADKALSRAGTTMSLPLESCELTVRCETGDGRTSLRVRSSSTEVVCAGCTPDQADPICSVR